MRRRIVLLLAVTAVVLAAGAVLWARHELRGSLPLLDGSHVLPGVSAPVIVTRDALGIPTVQGRTREDVARATGFLHAQERFYEMDVRRHTTAGRLSELFGPDTLEIDLLVRTLGWRRVAEQELAMLQPRTRGAIEAYAAGVNAYLETHTPSEIAVQYTVLGLGGLDYQPEPWTAADSLAWLKAMAWDLKGNLDDAGIAYDHVSGSSLYFRDPDGVRLELISDPLGEMYGTTVA